MEVPPSRPAKKARQAAYDPMDPVSKSASEMSYPGREVFYSDVLCGLFESTAAEVMTLKAELHAASAMLKLHIQHLLHPVCTLSCLRHKPIILPCPDTIPGALQY